MKRLGDANENGSTEEKEKIMTSDLILAQRTKFAMPLMGDCKSETNQIAIDAIKHLVPKSGMKSSVQEQKYLSYKLFVFVLIAHLSVLVWLNKNNSEVAVIQQQTKIFVSLLGKAEPVSKPEAKPQEAKQPIIKRQISKPEQKKLTNDNAVKEAEMVAAATEKQLTETKNTETEAVVATSDVQKSMQAELPAKDQVEQVTEPPKFGAAYLQNPAPEYPPLARRKGEQGRVLLQVLVSENGKAEKVQIDTSSGYSSLDQAALEAVRKWSFMPAKKGNRPISAYVIVPIRFSLNG